MKIGLIADTHGLLRPEAITALAGVEQIIHAGDIGAPELLEALRAVAPVHAVRGNNDLATWALTLPETLALRMGGLHIAVLHDVKDLRMQPDAAGPQVIVSGHSHKPAVVHRQGLLFVNPGSAGPRRFRLPVSIGYLVIERGRAQVRIRELL